MVMSIAVVILDCLPHYLAGSMIVQVFLHSLSCSSWYIILKFFRYKNSEQILTGKVRSSEDRYPLAPMRMQSLL